jgi:lipopolysaccharide/colanic/teichoic acid biosynthesis glycosyltransferase
VRTPYSSIVPSCIKDAAGWWKQRRHPVFYRKYGKRILGIILSSLGLLFLWPVMIIIAITIKCDSRGSIIFKQKRLGKDKTFFYIYKFRTMDMNTNQLSRIYAYEGDPRITKVGAFLRKTSLDELPQLINILKGDMCFLGPRPLLTEAQDQYKDHDLFQKRLQVTPGLFCSVDVCYRAAATKELQFQMDSDYIDHISFITDLVIFCKIIIMVIKQKNIYNSQT